MGDRVGAELLYNSVKTEVKAVEFEMQLQLERSYRRDKVGKATPSRGGSREPRWSWGQEKMLIRCSKESQHPAEWTPGPPVEHQENEKDTTLTAIRVGVKILQFMFGHQLPLTRKTLITFSNSYNKVRGTNIFLKKSSCVCYLCHYVSCMNMYMRIQHIDH